MELRHLRYFLAVASERNFTAAARRLNISQPPLSRQIRQLEEEIGAPLFKRDARPLELTEAGRLLHEHATRVLERVAEIGPSLAALSTARRIDLPVGFVGSTIYGALPQAIRLFRADRPDLDIRMLEMTTLEQIGALRDRRIAVGFGRLLFHEPEIEQRPLWNEPLVAALPLDPGAAAPPSGEEPVPAAELMARPLIVYPRHSRPSYADQVLALLHDRGLAPKAVIEVRELQTALGLVACGYGAALIPTAAAASRRDLRIRAVSEPEIASPVVASTRRGEDRAEVDAFIETVRRFHEESAPGPPARQGMGDGA